MVISEWRLERLQGEAAPLFMYHHPPRNFRVAEIALPQRVDPTKQIFFARDAGDLIAQLPVFEKE